ncbi:MAG: DUF2066 domain-containing protein [Candidatus Rariloculaceae bacterium]
MARFSQVGRILRVARAKGVAIALCLCGSSLFAAVIDDLYSVTVSRNLDLAPGQQIRTQEEEARFALARLLIRVTGRVDAALEPDLAGMLQNATDYVLQIGSLDLETVLVTFDQRAIEAALVAREQPIWGPERPLTLLWLAIDNGQGERGILPADETVSDISPAFLEAQAELREQAGTIVEDRGLPLALPLLDLEDMNALSFVDIWAGFNEQVTRASERYGADAVLVGRIRTTRFGVEFRWTLLRNGQQYSLAGNSLREGLDRLADLYAAEFSTLGGRSETFLTITGVESLDDYGRVTRYLESLSVLEAVATEELVDGALSLRVEARGGADVLGRVVGLSELLHPADPLPGAEPGRGGLMFTLDP